MKNIAVIVKQGKISWSPTKIAVGLNDYLNSRGFTSKVYIADGYLSSPSFVFSNKIDLAIHKLLFRLTGKDGCYSHFSTRKLLREFDRNNVDTIYIAMLHSFFINETMLFNYIVNPAKPLNFQQSRERGMAGHRFSRNRISDSQACFSS